MAQTHDSPDVIRDRFTSARIILIAQSLSVTASVLGLFGLFIAYRALKNSSGGNGNSTSKIPTIG